MRGRERLGGVYLGGVCRRAVAAGWGFRGGGDGSGCFCPRGLGVRGVVTAPFASIAFVVFISLGSVAAVFGDDGRLIVLVVDGEQFVHAAHVVDLGHHQGAVEFLVEVVL